MDLPQEKQLELSKSEPDRGRESFRPCFGGGLQYPLYRSPERDVVESLVFRKELMELVEQWMPSSSAIEHDWMILRLKSQPGRMRRR